MISLQKVDNAIKFTFTDSQHYLYGDGVIAVPVNSLLLVEDKSDAVTFKKIDGDVFVSAPVAEFGMSKAEIEAFYKENMVGSTGGGDITSGEVQTMIDESISGKADTSAVTAVNDVLTAHTANTTIHVTAGDKLTWDGKQDALTAGTGIDITNDVISCTVTGGNNVVELTQAQYDALVDKDPDAFYIITDAPAIDLSGYAQTSAVTAEITAAVSGKQDALVSGTNIKTINNESLLGSGNIDIQGGGGSTYTAGDGINIENDVISTSYSGYHVSTEPERFLTNFEGQCLILVPYDCEGSTQGDAHFDVDGHNYNFTFHPDNQTFDDNGDSSWQNYFSIEWDSDKDTFKLTTNENQPIDAGDDGCVRFKDLAPVILYSGTTTDGINGALDEINEAEQVTARALNDLNDRFGGLRLVKLSQQEYDGLTEKDSNTLYVIVN